MSKITWLFQPILKLIAEKNLPDYLNKKYKNNLTGTLKITWFLRETWLFINVQKKSKNPVKINWLKSKLNAFCKFLICDYPFDLTKFWWIFFLKPEQKNQIKILKKRI
jgi:hypothetical protein